MLLCYSMASSYACVVYLLTILSLFHGTMRAAFIAKLSLAGVTTFAPF